ncbi:hypothetical protein [Altibacter lentus]|uniref:hypothetical protein n=1 Tax=Altibacter lentus TaxID=1223410 RepID=UPI0005562C8A|nr:hypothetical protein [Altibacter lentus]
MKRIAVLFCCLPFTLIAQEVLEPLTTPSAPAATILELQPKVILQPKSYQTLETALYSNFLNETNEAVIPANFALEFTPYWTTNHGLSLMDYLYPETLADQLLRNSSFSLASTQSFVLGDSTTTNGIGFGYRTSFFFPNTADKETTRAAIEAIQKDNTLKGRIQLEAFDITENRKVANKSEFLLWMDAVVIRELKIYSSLTSDNDLKAILENITKESRLLPELDLEHPDPFIDQYKEIVDNAVKTKLLLSNFESYLKNRQGLTIDVALASLLVFPTNSFEFSYLPKNAIWLTPSYRFSRTLDFLQVLGVLRYEWYLDEFYDRYFPNTFTYQHTWDYGLSAVSEFKRLSLQFELVGRQRSATIPAGFDAMGNALFRKEKDNDLQYAGTIAYQLTDKIVLSYTLGSRFETILNPSETLISLLCLNFGFGGPNMSDLELLKE